jgi:hypothetical protein
MPATLAFAGLLLAQAAQPGITVQAPTDPHGIGYRELVAQKPAAAMDRIAADWNANAEDPAARINLGTAAARLGDRAAARKHYRIALTSRERYDLELADGTWMDSRDAARLALAMLAKNQALALR